MKNYKNVYDCLCEKRKNGKYLNENVTVVGDDSYVVQKQIIDPIIDTTNENLVIVTKSKDLVSKHKEQLEEKDYEVKVFDLTSKADNVEIGDICEKPMVVFIITSDTLDEMAELIVSQLLAYLFEKIRINEDDYLLQKKKYDSKPIKFILDIEPQKTLNQSIIEEYHFTLRKYNITFVYITKDLACGKFTEIMIANNDVLVFLGCNKPDVNEIMKEKLQISDLEDDDFIVAIRGQDTIHIQNQLVIVE